MAEEAMAQCDDDGSGTLSVDGNPKNNNHHFYPMAKVREKAFKLKDSF